MPCIYLLKLTFKVLNHLLDLLFGDYGLLFYIDKIKQLSCFIGRRFVKLQQVVAVLTQLSCSAFLALNALLRTVHVQRKSPGPFGWSRLPTVRGCMLARVASSVDCPKRVDRAAT